MTGEVKGLEQTVRKVTEGPCRWWHNHNIHFGMVLSLRGIRVCFITKIFIINSNIFVKTILKTEIPLGNIQIFRKALGIICNVLITYQI